jgi:hypothetical protein
MRKGELCDQILQDFEDGVINQKRTLRLITDKKIDHPHQLEDFVKIFIRGAIRNKINFDQPMYATVDTSKITNYEEYLTASEKAEKENRMATEKSVEKLINEKLI